jgi:hypothetical protein
MQLHIQIQLRGGNVMRLRLRIFFPLGLFSAKFENLYILMQLQMQI